MSKIVVILHGYSDEATSFYVLAQFLVAQGFKTQPVYLGNYITLEDHVTIQDLAEGLEMQLRALEARQSISLHGEAAFDLIVHSTGSLVAREWLTRFYLEKGLPSPVDHFVMLAPANFGSPLGAIGRTMLGRVIKGWDSNFQSGARVLTALEMASPYTRELALRDVLSPNSFYTPARCKVTVLVGSQPYQEGLRKVVDKNGGDGTVYVCTANLNTSYVRIDMAGKDEKAQLVPDSLRSKSDIAFGAFPGRNHTTITLPDAVADDGLGKFIVDALTVDEAGYAAFRERCRQLTAQTLPEEPTADIYHTYLNLVSHVADRLDFPVRDYFLEFYEKDGDAPDSGKVDELMVAVHSDIIESVHNYGDDASYRSLIFDLTDLKRLLLDSGRKLMFSLSAAPLSPLIGYSCDQTNEVGELPISAHPDNLFWRPNQTFFADLVVGRRQGSKDKQVFEILTPPPAS